MFGDRLSGENRSLKGTGVDGRDGPVFELLKQGETLGITLRTESGIASALNSPLRIPGRLPMPCNIDLNQ
jgi:hypothetical protein